MSSLTLLGTGTCQIEFARRASSVLLELVKPGTARTTYIVFDCGHGVVQRILECGVQHQQVQHIVLSHFHPDHISDLIPFLQAGAHSRHNPRDTDVHIYGPLGVQQIVDKLMDIFGPRLFQRSSYQVCVHEIPEGPFTIGEYTFESVNLPPEENHGIRFSYDKKIYALTGDSHFHDKEIAFLQGVDLAVIDAGHLKQAEIVKLAVATQAKVIVCSHLYSKLPAHDLQRRAEEKGYNGIITVGRDLMSFML